MTTEDEKLSLIERAADMVSALCAPKGSEGSREWVMSIPARPDHDPDLIIAAGLQAGREAVNTLSSREKAYMQMEEALERICDKGMAWSSPPIDSEAANTYAQIAAEMQAIASAALTAAREAKGERG